MYREMKQAHQKRVNEFTSRYAFFAFNDEQFDAGLQKLGLDRSRLDQITRGYAGMYILADKAEDFTKLLEANADEQVAALADPEDGYRFAVEMFRQEMNNHEFDYTGDPEETLNACGYDVQEVAADKMLSAAFNEAAGREVF